MRTKREITKRLIEVAEARKQLLDEEAEAIKNNNVALQQDLAVEIANLGGAISTFEWVLNTDVTIEYAVEAEDEDLETLEKE